MKVQPTLGSTYSGSLRGLTASHNKGGLYFRGRTVPTNPNSTRQQITRSVLGALSSSWTSSLTAAQRAAWNDYAANTPLVDTLGNSINVTGLNMYIRANATREQRNIYVPAALLTTISDAPTIFNTGVPPTSVTAFEGDFTTPPGTVSLDINYAAPLPADGDVFFFIAPPQTAGTTFYKGPYQMATVFAVSATDTTSSIGPLSLDMPTSWIAATTPVVGWDGLNIPVRAIVVTDDGRQSQDYKALVPFTDATP